MDLRLEMLDELLNSDVVGYQLFNLKYKKDACKEVIYCFIEGEDYKYYLSRIESIVGKKPIFIECNGREGVVDATNLVLKDENFKNDLICSFIDRDYFEPENYTDDIYKTDYYSIETYYCLEEVLEKLLKYYWRIPEESDLYDSCITLYQLLHNQFVEEILFFSVWSEIQVRYTEEERREFYSQNPKGIFKAKNFIRLKNIKIIKLIDFSLQNVTAPKLKSSNSIKGLSREFENAVDIADDYINERIQKISEDKKRLYIRGKFDIEFLIEFMKKLSIELNKRDGIKIPQHLVDPLTLFSNYAVTPENLRSYLNSFLFKLSHSN